MISFLTTCAVLRTLGSRSIRIALGMYRVSSLYRCGINRLRSRGEVLKHAYLVEEDVLAITAFGRKVLQIAVSTDAVLLT